MDADRRSNLSSFYGSGGRRSSFNPDEVLSSPRPAPLGQQTRVDSPSAPPMYNPNRVSQNSADLLTGDTGTAALRGTAGSAGYNRTSFFAPGREEPVKGGRDEQQPLRSGDVGVGGQDEGWDVFADFNNVGPRYSTAFRTGDAGYRVIPAGASKPDTPRAESEAGAGRVELVTVPALGSEWKSSELRGMTKSGKREARAEKRAAKWRAFRRDEHGFCGIKWLSRRIFVWIVFFFVVIVGIILAFTIPRVPGFAFNGDTPLSGSGSVVFSRTPANFSFNTNLDLQIDTNSNYLPLRLNNLHAQVFDSDTNAKIAEGDLPATTFPAKAFSNVLLPVTFNYTAVNDTDQTWLNVYNACRNSQNVPANQSRPPIKFRITLQMAIAGLISHPTAGTAVQGAPCPFELPTNSV